ncbi:tryptophan transporter [Clostridium estertheticum]|uniref:tryptophan transporter n=1 Tax=Clostridium estertheticum TaxID=238834 RepID=UPI001CF4D634|nr:tryptophan transporter [Clostridium estertheticum]MCB2306288.1 tryptophan transporter [Clostridium estertheticum]MCB2344461.1 tryptophan transporter [Clostridium estertheticum]MCB2349380.1 tryptophan transporter [Clostridium estertheticum]WAG45119.1 tryptophan transporter [Clostridium estertheticum]
MKTNKIIITSLLLAIGLILHQITPGIFLGMKPDLLLVFMILSITITKDFKIALITGIVAGVLCALTTTFPGGQLPSIIDKTITSIIVYFIYKSLKSNSSLKLSSIYFLGTIVSGSIFLSSALFLFGLPAPFLALFVSIVLPTSVFNCFVGFSIHKLIATNPALKNKFINF